MSSLFELNAPSNIVQDFMVDKPLGTMMDFTKGFVSENLLGLALKTQFDIIDNVENQIYPAEAGYNPYNDSQLEGMSEMWHLVGDSASSAQTSSILARYLEDKAKLPDTDAFFWGRLTGGILDPSVFVPGSILGKAVSTYGYLKTAGMGATVLGGEEIAKQALDPQRNPDLLPYVMIGGGIAAPIIGRLTRPVSPKTEADFIKRQDGLDEMNHAAESELRSAGAAGKPSSAAEQKKYADLLDLEGLSKAWGLESWRLTPMHRLLNSRSLFVRRLAQELTAVSAFLTKNFDSGPFGATLRPVLFDLKRAQAQGITVRQMVKDLHVEHMNQTQKVGKEGLTIPQLEREITRAIMNNFRHEIPEIAKAAKEIHAITFKWLGDRGNKINIWRMEAEREVEMLSTLIESAGRRATIGWRVGRRMQNLPIKEAKIKLAELKEKLEFLKTFKLPTEKGWVPVYPNRAAIESRRGELAEIIVRKKGQTGEIITSKDANKIIDNWVNEDMTELWGTALRSSTLARSLHKRKLFDEMEDYVDIFDFLDTNILSLYNTYARSFGADLVLAERFGSIHLTKQIDAIRNEYGKLWEKAKTSKEKTKITKEMNSVIKDVEGLRDLHRGIYGVPENPNRPLSRGIRMVKQFNAMTMLSGWVAAIPDLARVVMHDGFSKTMKIMYQTLFEDFGAIKLARKEAQLVMEATDLTTGSLAARWTDITEPYPHMMGKIERGMYKANQLNFAFINAMSAWNEGVKSLASLVTGTRILDMTEAWRRGTISPTEIAKLKAAGIDRPMAERIANMRQHYIVNKHTKIANTHDWVDTGAADAYLYALHRDINHIIVTPNIGDTPLFTSTEFGALMFQFKKFSFAATNRIILSGLQNPDKNFLSGLALLVALGGVVHALRTEAHDRDYSDLPFGEKLTGAIDRSAVLGIIMDGNNMLEKISNNSVGLRPILGGGQSYRSSMSSKFGAILGPTAQTFMNVSDIFWDSTVGEYDQWTARNVRRMVPANAVHHLDVVFDQFEKTIR